MKFDTRFSRTMLGLTTAWIGSCATTNAPQTFETPDQALRAFTDLAVTGDVAQAERLFGARASDALRSGDPIADHEDALAAKALIDERLAFDTATDGSTVALLGNDGWPFPIPLIRSANGWQFDFAAGESEILNRRIGRNELSTLASLHALVDAQREYCAEGRDGAPPAFARKLLSQPGKHDGLYWDAREGEPQSPLGPLVGEAEEFGYGLDELRGTPYHGYCFRLLTAQGAHALCGAMSYLDEQGRMTGGFAALAWPAKYGNSGVMSFMVSDRGFVFEKDLGDDTGKLAPKIESFDPDATWTLTGD